MSRTKVRQDTQIRHSEVYDDTIPPGATLETDADCLEFDLNALRSQMRRVIGELAWWDDPSTNLAALAGMLGVAPAGTLRTNVIPSGLVDGANFTYTTPDFFVSNANTSVIVNLNGKQLDSVLGDFTASEGGGVGSGYDTITINPACPPKTGDILRVDYLIAGSAPPSANDVNVLDEGVFQAQQSSLNFIGPAIAAVDDPGNSRVDITVSITADMILPGFVVSFSMSPSGPFETGESVVAPTFSIGATGGTIASYSVLDDDGNAAIVDPATTMPYTYVKTANNDSVTFTATTTSTTGVIKAPQDSFLWQPRVYHGSAVAGTLDETFIENLALASDGDDPLRPSRNLTISYNGTASENNYYAFPTAYGGSPLFKDSVTGFDAGFSQVASSVSVTNGNGVTQTYEVWASNFSGLGPYAVVVT